jgi:hypothetical protein
MRITINTISTYFSVGFMVNNIQMKCPISKKLKKQAKGCIAMPYKKKKN